MRLQIVRIRRDRLIKKLAVTEKSRDYCKKRMSRIVTRKQILALEVEAIKSEMDRIEHKIADIQRTINPHDWKQAAFDCLCTRMHISTASDIVRAYLGPDGRGRAERLAGEKQIQHALIKLCRQGILRSSKALGVNGNLYGLPEWFRANGIPKRSFLSAPLRLRLEKGNLRTINP